MEPTGTPIRSLNKQIAATLEDIQQLKKQLDTGKKPIELKKEIEECVERLHVSTHSLKYLDQYHEDFVVSINPKVSKHLEALTAFLFQKNKTVQEKMGQEVIKVFATALNEFKELISRLDVNPEEENLIRVTKVDQDPLSR